MLGLGFLSWKKRLKTLEQLEQQWQKQETHFYNFIDKCAKKNKNREIECIIDKHVAYILKTIFRYAQNEVCIFTYGLDGPIFNDKDLILEAIKFLTNPESRLKIVYKDPNLEKDVLNTEFVRSILIS